MLSCSTSTEKNDHQPKKHKKAISPLHLVKKLWTNEESGDYRLGEWQILSYLRWRDTDVIERNAIRSHLAHRSQTQTGHKKSWRTRGWQWWVLTELITTEENLLDHGLSCQGLVMKLLENRKKDNELRSRRDVAATREWERVPYFKFLSGH